MAAARALGETGDRTIIEVLARATIEDPDEQVQQAALESLYLVAGEQEAMDLLDQVNLASYEEEWLLIPDELEFIDGGC